jgi:hypothetical protein
MTEGEDAQRALRAELVALASLVDLRSAATTSKRKTCGSGSNGHRNQSTSRLKAGTISLQFAKCILGSL